MILLIVFPLLLEISQLSYLLENFFPINRLLKKLLIFKQIYFDNDFQAYIFIDGISLVLRHLLIFFYET